VDLWAAVVLAGGRARRLGGLDKPALTVDGRSLLNHVLAACAGADPLIVVGPHRGTQVAVRWTRERPAGGGPVAALAAGLSQVPKGVPVAAVLAADLPRLRPDTLLRLRVALSAGMDGAVLVDASGQPQWLCGVWRAVVLRGALTAAGDPANLSLRGVLMPLDFAPVPAAEGEATDVDTPQDLRAARRQ
jgi:molybdopterin-guanine dinucleotide biosynthesis protein A